MERARLGQGHLTTAFTRRRALGCVVLIEMEPTGQYVTWETKERNPTTWLRRSLLLIFALALCGLAVDFVLWGPIRAAFWDVLVVRPVERMWGFHAEWRQVAGSDSHLVIVAVAPGGPFDTAGIRTGSFVPHPRCAWYLLRGGFYGDLADTKQEAVLRIVPDQLPTSREEIIVVKR
jgi:hypothetical protein